MSKKFSEVYHLYCESIEILVQERLTRPLTKIERASIWNIGSLLLLEAFERQFVAAQPIEEVLTLLKQQGQASAKALEHALDGLVAQVSGLLQRSLSYEEEQKLRTIQMVEEAMRFAEELIEVPAHQRVPAFKRMIDRVK